MSDESIVADTPDELVELYRARGLAEAHALRIQLEEEGIAAQVDNEMLQGIVGEVPGGWVVGQFEIWPAIFGTSIRLKAHPHG